MADERSERERALLAGIQALVEMKLRPGTGERFRKEADKAIDNLRDELAKEQAKCESTQ